MSSTAPEPLVVERRAFFARWRVCPECSSAEAVAAYRKPHATGTDVGLWCDACDRWLIWIPHRLLSRRIHLYPLRPARPRAAAGAGAAP